ncbi:DUF4180 domain-containing protein [Chromobacterium sphagni]|uniref:Alpha/beta hydrolase n=1 Tax=Chromobacterium sphagni TaxID=1903179 RepID=A0A1S1X5B7_9NEIS|nr:DUF4180 domain-containing protein [Chromobacterium sphagni]OHX14639.1 alpha/beta hydrolase [Chromobacterium sphagni]OHX20695.1 alpha/beta hydrolase [Chromobacterium sphagni]
MEIKLIERDSIRVAHVLSTDAPIKTRQDALDVMMGHGHGNLTGIAVEEACLHPDFFQLKTGLAGELLQMFVNYRQKIAIIGNFSKYTSSSLRDFIVESNRGKQVFFVSCIDEAIRYLSHS